jgi:hypothetical protein
MGWWLPTTFAPSLKNRSKGRGDSRLEHRVGESPGQVHPHLPFGGVLDGGHDDGRLRHTDLGDRRAEGTPLGVGKRLATRA